MMSVAGFYALPAIQRLRSRNGLTYGGRSGLWSDTVESLLGCWLYARPYGAALRPVIRVLTLLVLAVAVLVAILPSRAPASRSAIPSVRALTAILLGGGATTVLQHFLFGTPFLLNRTASWMLLLLLLLLVLEVEVGLGSGSRSWRTASKTCSWTAAALSVLHAGLCANTRFAILQYPDADTKAMLRDLEALHASGAGRGRLRLGRSWELAPVIEFYRVTRALNWLNPIADGPGSWDAAFLSPKDLGSRGRLIVWRRYPTTGNTLLLAPDRDGCRDPVR
jgi:hypothetical protein